MPASTVPALSVGSRPVPPGELLTIDRRNPNWYATVMSLRFTSDQLLLGVCDTAQEVKHLGCDTDTWFDQLAPTLVRAGTLPFGQWDTLTVRHDPERPHRVELTFTAEVDGEPVSVPVLVREDPPGFGHAVRAVERFAEQADVFTGFWWALQLPEVMFPVLPRIPDLELRDLIQLANNPPDRPGLWAVAALLTDDLYGASAETQKMFDNALAYGATVEDLGPDGPVVAQMLRLAPDWEDSCAQLARFATLTVRSAA